MSIESEPPGDAVKAEPGVGGSAEREPFGVPGSAFAAVGVLSGDDFGVEGTLPATSLHFATRSFARDLTALLLCFMPSLFTLLSSIDNSSRLSLSTDAMCRTTAWQFM